MAYPVNGWFVKPRYGGRDFGLMLSCGHVRWVPVRGGGQARRMLGRKASCERCQGTVWVCDVLDWSWLAR